MDLRCPYDILIPMTDDKSLTWKITPEEQKSRGHEYLILLLFSLPFVVWGIFSTATSRENSFDYDQMWEILSYGGLFILLVVGIIVVILILNKFFPYKERTYSLDDYGVTISKGGKKKTYSWDDFVCFYAYTEDRNSARPSISSRNERNRIRISENTIKKLIGAGKKAEEIVGQMFYLRKRSLTLWSQFYKVIVVVYSEPDNITTVRDFLSKHLPRKHTGANIDFRLTMYRFK